MTLDQALNVAAGHLPEDWQINVSVERGAGWVDLFGPEGQRIDFDTSPDNDMAQQIDDAVDHARKYENLPPHTPTETGARRDE